MLSTYDQNRNQEENEREKVEDNDDNNNDKTIQYNGKSLLSFPSKNNWMETLMRARRCTGPKEVLLRLAINRHVLQMQIAAVQIQTSYRRFAAQKRVERIKYRLKLFNTITETISTKILEEAVLAVILEMCFDVIKSREFTRLFRTKFTFALDNITNEIIDECCLILAFEVVEEIIRQAADSFLDRMK
jgi:hypothetical protein